MASGFLCHVKLDDDGPSYFLITTYHALNSEEIIANTSIKFNAAEIRMDEIMIKTQSSSSATKVNIQYCIKDCNLTYQPFLTYSQCY